MIKVIQIGDKEVRLNNNVAWTMEYRDQFNKDIVPAVLPVIASILEAVATIAADVEKDEDGKIAVSALGEAIQGRAIDIMLPLFQVEFVDVIIDVTWAMAKAADENIDPPTKWVRQFDEFPLDVIVPAVGELLIKGFVSSKNVKRLESLPKELKKLQPLRSTTSSSQEQSEA